jgi:NitT/TauT family transport system substrate-binding protein
MPIPTKFAALAAGALAMVALVPAAPAAEKINFILNWVPGADHAPYFYAKAKGWYKDAGLEVDILSGKGSGLSSQRVGAGTSQLGISDLATAIVAKSKGANLVAVMNVYANSPYGMYWLKKSGIRGPKDFVGKKIGNPPWDAARVMWPAFAKAVGLPKDAVEFVSISPQAKAPSLLSGQIDITTNFYNGYDTMKRLLGKDMGFLAWSDAGLNHYGNSIIANGAFLKSNRAAIAGFVRVSQKAFAACVADAKPCIDALMEVSSGLKRPDQNNQWSRVKELMTDKFTTSVALGYMDPGRMVKDYNLVATYFKMKTPFDIKTAYTNEFLDRSVKMTK